MKFTLALSLFLMLPIHAMETDTRKQLDSENGIPELYKNESARPARTSMSSGTRKKIGATALISLIALGGIATNASQLVKVAPTNDIRLMPPHQLFPTPDIYASCKYYEKTSDLIGAQCYVDTEDNHCRSWPSCHGSHVIEIDTEYCKNNNTLVGIEKCTVPNPCVDPIRIPSILSMAYYAGILFTSMFGIWGTGSH